MNRETFEYEAGKATTLPTHGRLSLRTSSHSGLLLCMWADIAGSQPKAKGISE